MYDPVRDEQKDKERNQQAAAAKRKRSLTPPPGHRLDKEPGSDSTLHKKLRAEPPRRLSPAPGSPPRSPPRQRKRPGAAARIGAAEREAYRQRQAQRERQQQEQTARAATSVHNAVKEHYNTVEQRGRDWRRTESQIKGLRNYNNWVKSTLIQKFSPNEDYAPGGRSQGSQGLVVLDIGCGKGGDLGKWQKAPQRVDLYVGVDPADVSIEQARGRYLEARAKCRGRMFQGEFFAKDGYGEWLGEIPVIREVGIDGGVGPGGGTSARWGGGGFDVVTMMFCMHYAFESEEKARGMLRNVAGALKKGGRLIGVIPNSDIIRDKVEAFHRAQAQKHDNNGGDGADGAKVGKDVNATIAAVNGDAEGKSDAKESRTERPKEPVNAAANGGRGFENETKDSKTERSAKPVGSGGRAPTDAADATPETEQRAAPEWGNSIYRVRFPGQTPEDGIFRPPFGWRYNYFMREAVEEVPEYVVPFEAFRALAEDYNLEMQYRKSFADIWAEEKNDPILGPLSVRMGVTDREGGELKMTEEEVEAVGFYHAFCFYRV